MLAELGVAEGDRVFVLAGRIPELYIAALGTLKNRSVFCPLFSAFGPEPIRLAWRSARPRVLVTTESLYERKVAGTAARAAALEHVIVVGDGARTRACPDTRLRALDAAATDGTIAPTGSGGSRRCLHFTSGTTGTPKGAIHVHEAVVAHHMTGKLALDLHPDDVFWCTADPGLGDRHVVRHHRAARPTA